MPEFPENTSKNINYTSNIKQNGEVKAKNIL